MTDVNTLVLRTEYKHALEQQSASQETFAKVKDLERKLSPEVKKAVPWLKGAIEHAVAYAALQAEARRWRLVAFAALAMLGGSVAGNVYQSTTSRVEPYIVQVDKHGFTVPIAPAQSTRAADPRVVMSQLGRWVIALRSRLADRVAQKRLLDETFAMVPAGAPSSDKARKQFKERDAHVGDTRVDVELSRIQPMSDHTFTVDWSERHQRAHGMASTHNYSAVITTDISPSRMQKEILVNPLGVYVTDFSITQLK